MFPDASLISLQVFETTIRVLGGLLSSFYLSGGDKALLDKAVDLGERWDLGERYPLLACLQERGYDDDSMTGLPFIRPRPDVI